MEKTTPTPIDCPACKFGIIKKAERRYHCSEYRNGCTFSLPVQLANRCIADILEDLIKTKRTATVNGFVN